MTQLITNRGGHMINFTALIRNGERVMRVLPLVNNLLPDNKAGLNSLILKDSEILKLNKKIKELEKALYAKKQEIVVLEKKIEKVESILKDYRSAIGE